MSTKDATRRLGGRARTNAVGADCRDNNCMQPTKKQQVRASITAGEESAESSLAEREKER